LEPYLEGLQGGVIDADVLNAASLRLKRAERGRGGAICGVEGAAGECGRSGSGGGQGNSSEGSHDDGGGVRWGDGLSECVGVVGVRNGL
jgi:hypothetical protein